MMPWHDEDPWEDIKAQHPLLEVVQGHVKMKPTGGNEWRGLCPFHDEKTPSFDVNTAKEKFFCRGCGAHGDVLDFVQGIRSCTKPEAIEYLTGGKIAVLPEPVRRERDRLKVEAEEQEAARKASGSAEAAKRWARASRVDPAHPYLVRKGASELVEELHLARSEADCLIVPMYDAEGEIQSVQAIAPDGGKKFHAGAPSKLARLLIGLNFGGRVVVCEGFATGCSIFTAWPEQICVTFSAGNMEQVARDFHSRGVPILLAPDKDQMAHFETVARELDCPVIGPDVPGNKADFNDQHLAAGADAVLRTFMDGLRDYSTKAEREKREAERENEPLDLWTKTPVPGFPEAMLPPIIARFARIRADMIGCDPSGIAMAALAACGTLITDRIRIRPKEHDQTWHEAARLWVMLVGAPSRKKSPIIGAATRHLAKLDMALIREHDQALRAWNEDKEGVPPVPKRLRISDITMEAAAEVCATSPDGVLSLQDELTGWFGGIDKYSGGKGSAKDRSFWLQAYQGGQYATDRVGRKAAFVENLSISMVGGVQPQPIQKIMRETNDDGLMQRFLPIVLGEPSVGKDIEMPDVTAEYDRLQDALYAMQPPANWAGDLPLMFSPEAQALRNSLEARHHGMMTSFEEVNRKVASHIGKYDGIFARLCVIFHCIAYAGTGEPLPAVVGIDTAKRVEGFLHRFLRRHAMAFYTNVAGMSDDHDILSDIGGYIIAHKMERVTLRNLARGTQAMKRITNHEGHAIFEQLVAHGWLEEDSKRSDARAWKVNPAVHTLFADRAEGEKARRERARATIREMLDGNG